MTRCGWLGYGSGAGILLGAAVYFALLLGRAEAQIQYTGTDFSLWSVGTNWAGNAVPGFGQAAILGETDTNSDVIMNDTYTAGTELAGLSINGTDVPVFLTLFQSAGAMIVTGTEIISDSTYGDEYNQSGGSNSAGSIIIGNQAASLFPDETENRYALSGSGTLAVGNLTVGNSGDGYFEQTGGSATVTGTLVIGSGTNSAGDASLYSLTSGTLNLGSGAVAAVGLRGEGEFTQSGGLVSGSGATLYVAEDTTSTGTYSLGGGMMTLHDEYDGYISTGNGALFAQTGGTNEISASGVLDVGYNSGAFGSYTLSGTGVLALDSGAGLHIGVIGHGAFTQTGGVVSGTGADLIVGYEVGSSGTYSLKGGYLNAGTEYIGRSNTTGNIALFAQTGGTNEVAASGSLYIGYSANSTGAYTLSGTGVLALDSIAKLTVGNQGTGVFTQSGGTVTDPTSSATVIVGGTSGSSGTYNLNGGSLTASTEDVGFQNSSTNTALFAQTGGTNAISNFGVLVIGNAAQSSGTYTLSGSGVLGAGSGVDIYVGDNGTGTFIQSGGAVSAGLLLVGEGSGSGGTYDLSGGSLGMVQETIGDGNAAGNTALIAQTGGTNTITGLLLVANTQGTSGTYTLANAGVLVLEPGTELLVSDNGTGTFTQSGGVVSGSGAKLAVGESASSPGTYNLSGGSLTASTELIGEGDSGGGTALFAQTGGTNTVVTSGSLTIGDPPASSGTYALSGTGTLTQDSGATLTVGNQGTGVFTQSGGAVSGATTNTRLIVGGTSGSSGIYNLNGGTLTEFGEYIGYHNASTDTASFVQTGGTNSLSAAFLPNLYIGYATNSSGSYNLSGSGTLICTAGDGILFVGYSGSGTFTQTGGVMTASNIILGENGGSSGTYNLSAGAVASGAETFGDVDSTGNALFAQTGGTNTLSASGFLVIANEPGTSGTYTLSGSGTLVLGPGSQADVGINGTGTFTQSGGTVSGSGALLAVGYFPGGTGKYNLNGGTLTASTEQIGENNNPTDTALFAQTGGINSIVPSGSLTIGDLAQSSGTYTLSGSGTLALGSGATLTVGNQGTGVFTLSGGVVNSNGFTYLLVGSGSGSVGTYNLNGGALTASQEQIGIGNAGANPASFVQTGGTNTASDELDVGYGSTGTYTLSGSGTLLANGISHINIGYSGGAVGTFNESGGAVSTTALNVGFNGSAGNTYNLNGGTLAVNDENIGVGVSGNTGLIAQTGGTNAVGSSGRLDVGLLAATTGTYTLSGSGVLTLGSGANFYVGDQGTGVVTQSGGVVSGSGASLIVANTASSSGTYNLNGGTLTASTENIGVSGTGAFVQAGGSNTVLGQLSVSGSGASYMLSGSGSLTASQEVIAAMGAKPGFMQTGGQHVVTGTITVSGSYQLNGGSLSTPAGGGFSTGAGGTFSMQGNGIENGDLQNNGTFQMGGGSFNGTLENYGTTTVSGTQNSVTFGGNVTNESGATFTASNTVVTYAGTFTNNGRYVSEPSTQNFNNLVIGASGWMTGGAADVFNISGNVLSTSTNKTAFNLSASHVTLQGAGTHTFTWTGVNLGATGAGYANNFAIGVFELGTGVSLDIQNGNVSGTVGIYVTTLLLDSGTNQATAINSNGADIFYDGNAPLNAYLDDNTYPLEGGGFIEPVAVPEPGTIALLSCGVGMMALRFRRRR